MGRRNKSGGNGASLDSLLDTMTNVVGILVIVLIVTQLGVGEAVDRITAELQKDERYTPEKVEEAKQKISQAKQDREQVEKELELLLAQIQSMGDGKTDRGQLSDFDGQISFARDQLDKILKTRVGELAAHNKQAEDARKEAEEFKKKEDALNAQFKAAEDRLASLKAMLTDTPKRTVLAAKVINLPNPRTAPEGAKPAYVICRDNKVYPWNRDQLRKEAQTRAEFLVVKRNLAANPKTGIDPKKLIPMFDKLRINDNWFLLKLRANGRQPRIIYERKAKAGFTIEEVENRRGPFQRDLQTLDPTKQYVRFIVYTNSYETYLAARAVVTSKGLMVGWDITTGTGETEYPLGGKILFGPEPPPNPNPPKPNPNPPKNKPLPSNTVD